MRNDFKFMKQVESKTNQFEIVFKSLAHFSTQFRQQKNFKSFSVLCRRVRTAKLTNRSARTNLEIQWNPAVTKCHGTEKNVRYSGVFVIANPRSNELSG